MEWTIRRAVPADAEMLARHRANVWREVGEWDSLELEAQMPVWATFFRRCLADETYVAFVAEEDGVPLASGAILVHLAIPRPKLDSARSGRVQSVWVESHARRRGVARAIMHRLLAFASDAALITLSLHPSDEARALYASVGFEAADEMTFLRPVSTRLRVTPS